MRGFENLRLLVCLHDKYGGWSQGFMIFIKLMAIYFPSACHHNPILPHHLPPAPCCIWFGYLWRSLEILKSSFLPVILVERMLKFCFPLIPDALLWHYFQFSSSCTIKWATATSQFPCIFPADPDELSVVTCVGCMCTGQGLLTQGIPSFFLVRVINP